MSSPQLLLLLVWACTLVGAFYIPGIAPEDYVIGATVDLKVNSLDSPMTQLPYEYYQMGFCKPSKVESVPENLGEILTGDRIENSDYEILTLFHQSCKVLCRMDYTDEQMGQFETLIREKYQVNWIIDNLPATTSHYLDTGQVVYEKGFPLGFVGNRYMSPSYAKAGVAYVNNHVVIQLSYHRPNDDEESGIRIVGFHVDPYSVKHVVEPGTEGDSLKLQSCNGNQHLYKEHFAQAVSGVEIQSTKEIYWTYDVVWTQSPVRWVSRWDVYLKMTNSEIHWFSIINSLVIVLFLSAFVAMIMIRTLRKDLAEYDNQALSAEEQQEETGWKLVHGDVFRPPKHGGWFTVMVGSGVQVLGMTVVTLLFALLGFLSPANRGGLMTAVLMFFSLMGIFAGFWGTRLYTMFKLTAWKTNTLKIALFFPGSVFAVFFFINLLIWGEKSSGAVPFATLIALLVLWFGISVPLVYLGSHLAVRREPIEPPLKVNPLPRTVQPSDWFTNSEFSVVIGGILPFAAAFIEIFFIMSSVWLHQFYYVFGFVFLVFVILLVTCAEISIVLCYFQLCHENHHWWWRSFLTSGSSALYLFLYSIFYYATKLEIDGVVPTIIFFGYMFLTSFAFFLATGAFGFIACYLFVHKIYSSVKID
jgi:transmembrane 9 superfamily protein 2/4